MTRFLFVPVPAAGHLGPMLTLARGVVARGHVVTVYTASRFRSAVERSGARFEPFRSAPDIEFERLHHERIFPDRPERPRLKQEIWDLKNLTVDLALQQYEDLCAIVGDAPIDVVVDDVSGFAGQFFAERRGLPLAVLNPVFLFAPSRDVFPPGPGFFPSSTALGRLRNRLANWIAFDVALREANTYLHAARARLGLPRVDAGMFEMPFRMSQLVLQPTVPGFEYPRSDLAPQLHFIGALLPPASDDWAPPSWWAELQEDRPAVLVTQGTIATDFDDLLRPTIAALAEQDVLVVATTGNRPVEELGEVSPNVRVEPFVPFGALMPHVDALITNGGYGGIHFALAHGVPLVVSGTTEDKTETSARVEWAGVGINLKSKRPTPEKIQNAITTVLNGSRYRERAKVLQSELDRFDGPSLGTELLERLAATGQMVPRM